MRPKKNHIHLRRLHGQRFRQQCILPAFKSDYQMVSVWGCFSMSWRTPLVGTIGSFDQDTYRLIVDNYVLPFMQNINGVLESFTLQKDNCAPHRAKSIATYLLNEEVNRMKWPAQSPNLNLIEIKRGLMKTLLLRRRTQPLRYPLHLFHTILTIWNGLSYSYFNTLVALMPRCIEQVHRNKSRSTKY